MNELTVHGSFLVVRFSKSLTKRNVRSTKVNAFLADIPSQRDLRSGGSP